MFRKEGEERIKKLLGIEEKKKASMWPKLDLGITMGEALRGPFQHPGEADAHKNNKEEKFPRFLMTPNDKEMADAIHLKISKIAFEATLRFVYIERRGATADSGHVNSIHGFIRQFNTQNLNQLKPYTATIDCELYGKGMFKKTRIRAKKHYLYENYAILLPMHHESILNIEELAKRVPLPIGGRIDDRA